MRPDMANICAAIGLQFKNNVDIKIIYEMSSLGRYSCVWKKGSCVDNYLELAHIDTDTL